MSFANKVVIVTGASSGIGAATAISFAKEGADVVLIGRNETKLNSVSEKCGKVGKTPHIIKVDISKDDEASLIVAKTIEKYGRLDVLVNNAGFSNAGSILDGNILKAYDAVMQTNIRAAIHLTSLAAPHLIKTKGNIVNISAIGGQYAPEIPQLLPYCISKAALNHFSRGAALELAASGVRVNVISPGPVKTDILENSGFPGTWDNFKVRTALNRVSEPEEIAELVLFLASDKAVGITGSNFVSDNGMLLKKSAL